MLSFVARGQLRVLLRGGIMTRFRFAAAIVVWCLICRTVTPQDAVPLFQTGVTVVNVPCVVRERGGSLARDLHKDNFEIFDEGKRQEIRYFARQADIPLTLGVLLDISGSVRDIVEREKRTAASFFRKILRSNDYGMVTSFADSVRLWQDFTASVEDLNASLISVRPVLGPRPFASDAPQGGTVLYDSITVTAMEKFRHRAGSKVIVLLSDGLETNSSVTLESAIKAAQATELIVYSICDNDPAHEELDAYRRLHRNDAIRFTSGCDALRAISEPTGGRMFRIGKNASVEQIFDAIADEIRGQYLLGFSPSKPAREGSFRKLEIKTKPAGLIVQARKGYYTFKHDE